MAQFYVIFNNGGQILVQAPDKYDAIAIAKERCKSNSSGVREVRNTQGKVV